MLSAKIGEPTRFDGDAQLRLKLLRLFMRRGASITSTAGGQPSALSKRRIVSPFVGLSQRVEPG